ncbi:tandem-95 repeat protein [uncultured Desulfuromonas sp.]|uniref:tandem-95 repeat protein n=1 Tax=uncultured Desulfuromonas sp. TaxID=181013 RepID=UPI002628B56B|nr:tandem-95 repeat protein [uncultured Desulfuromonas sp.]
MVTLVMLLLFQGTGFAAEMIIHTDNKTIGGSGTTVYGVPFTAVTSGDVTTFYIHGDFDVPVGDTLKGVGTRMAEMVVGNDATIPVGALVDFSATDSTPGPGGGAGGGAVTTIGIGADWTPGNTNYGGGGGGGARGGQGTGARPGSSGGAGSNGSSGVTGASGGSGQPGVSGSGGKRNQMTAAGGGASGAAGSPGSGGPGGGGAVNGGAGGGGGVNGVNWENGYNGTTGEAGYTAGSGGLGGNGGSGGGGTNAGTGETLSAGGGGGSGGTGGGGGAGGQGGGGRGGGGGGGGAGTWTGPGGTGGSGGHGGSGGSGAGGDDGGISGQGGNGGGAISLLVLGELTLGGEVQVKGSNGASGSPGGNAAGDVGLDGVAGSGGSAGGGECCSGDGGDGGSGGKGGWGGNGGPGGAGGAGGGGAGGSVKLVASVLVSAGGTVNATGGTGGNAGAKGRLIVGDSLGTAFSGTKTGVAATVPTSGPTATNPFLKDASGPVETPLISGLPGGAEAFGPTNLTRADFPQLSASTEPGLPKVAVVITDVGPTGYESSYPDHDYLFIVNLTDSALSNVSFGVGLNGSEPVENGLLIGGYANDPLFGGSADIGKANLSAGEVYVTLVPAGPVKLKVQYAEEGAASVSGMSADATAYLFASPNAGLGKALSFDGVNDRVIAAPINMAGDKFTLEAWIKPTDITTNTYYEIVRQNPATGSPDWLLSFQGKGTILSFGLHTSAEYLELDVPITAADFTDGSWHHVTATYDGATKRLYVDGVEIGTQSQSGTITYYGPGGAHGIGTSSWGVGNGSEHFKGLIDEVRIWNVAKSLAEIQAARFNPLKGNENNLVGYWPFEEGLCTLTLDRSVKTNDAVIEGAAWTSGYQAQPRSTVEDTAITLTLGGFDADNDGSSQLETVSYRITTLPSVGKLYQTSDGTTKGVQITSEQTVSDAAGRVIYEPNLNATGSDSFSYKAYDGRRLSADPASLSIAISAVNDTPTITGQGTIGLNEDTSRTLVFGDLVVTDPDDSYPADFTLAVQDGSNYTRSGNTITPAANFNGTLTVPVVVNDGTADSNTYNLSVTVNAVNDAPTVSNVGNQSTSEDTAVGPVAFSVADVETAASSLSVTASSNNTTLVPNGNIAIGGSGGSRSVTVTPAGDETGTATITLTVSDGSLSASDTFVVTVTAVNDAPTITDVGNQSTSEDSAVGPVAFDVADVETAAGSLSVTASSSNTTLVPNGNIAIGGSGGSRSVTVTPAGDETGTATITLTVSDGSLSASDTFVVTVTAVNDAPSITGQGAITIGEDAPRTIVFGDLTVTDVDNSYPTGFTLAVQNGSNYTRSGNTITPAANFNGTLTVPVVVNDGTADSNTYSLSVTVNAANDAPTITGQGTIALDEDTSRAIVFGDVSVTDVDNSYPTGFTLAVQNGSNYTRSGNTITPAANFTGTLTVPVVVNDGAANSNTFNLSVTVNAVNDAPTITGQGAVTLDEDMSRTIVFGDVSVSDVDDSYPTGFSLAVLGGVNYTCIGNTITSTANFNGTLTVPVKVNDGAADSNTFNLSVTVNAVNDVPTITDIANRSTPEDVTAGPIPFALGDVETAAASLTVTASSSNTALVPNGNISLGGSGANRNITLIPAANQSGSAMITVTVSDGTDSTNDSFVLTVGPVNDLPTISDIANRSTPEDVATGAISFIVGDTESAAASLLVTASSSNTALVPNGHISLGGSGTSRTLTLIPAANQFGSATITVTVDDGLDTQSDTFVLTVNAVNDVPAITDVGNQSTPEDTATSPIGFVVSDIEAASSSLTVTASSSNTTLVPNSNLAIGGSGGSRSVTVTPASDETGTATITLAVSDGSLSATDTFVVTVTAVNDAPTVTGQGAITVGEDASRTIVFGDLNVTDVDNSYPTGFTLAVQNGSNYTRSGNTITPAANFNGTLTVPVKVNDGTADSNSYNLSVTVNAVNDVPTITDVGNQSTQEDTATSPIGFVVGDIETAAGSLTVTASSSDQALVADAGIVVVGSGASRTVTITPEKNQTGDVTITLTVSDGSDTASDTFALNIGAVNDTPVLTGQSVLGTPEDTPLAITLDDVTVSDVDSTWPDDFTLTVLSGSNYHVYGATIVPVPDFSGTLTVPVEVSDGQATSEAYDLSVSVTAVNDAPVAGIGLGSALEFDGINDHVLVAPDASLDLADGTIEFWVKRGPTVGNTCVLANRGFSGSETRYSVHLSATAIGLWNGTSFNTVGFATTEGEWYHIALVDSGSDSEVFVDGVSVGTTGNAFNPLASGQNLTMGLTYSGSGQLDFEPFVGAIDEVRLWSVPRTVTEIRRTMNQPLAGDEANLVGYWPMDEATGFKIDDLSGDGNDGTLGGQMSASDWVAGQMTSRKVVVNGLEDNRVTVALAGADTEGDSLSATITALPQLGQLYQASNGTSPGAMITSVPTVVTDSQSRVIFEPVANSTADQDFAYRVEDASDASIHAVAVRLAIAPTNDRPTSASNTVQTTQNTPYRFSGSDFAFNDIDGDVLKGIQVTYLPADGSLSLGSSAVGVNQVVSANDLGSLVFTPAPNESGVGYDSFAFRVFDGTEFSQNSYFMTFDVEASRYVLTSSASAHGAIFPAGSVTKVYGTSQTYVISSDSGYLLKDVVVDGRPIGAVTSYTFSDIDRPHSINAIFVKSEATLQGRVLNSAGAPLSGATVSVAGASSSTGSDGLYSMTVPGGSQNIKVERAGFFTQEEAISVAPGGTLIRNYKLYSTVGDNMAIVGINSKYSDHAYFVEGIDHDVTYTVDVKWGVHPKGDVHFTSSNGTSIVGVGAQDQVTTLASASKSYNVGDLDVCSKLYVQAVSADGTVTQNSVAPFSIMPRPAYMPAMEFVPPPLWGDDSFSYKGAPGPIDLLTAMIPQDMIPSDVPLFSGGAIELDFVPTVESEIDGNELEYVLSGSGFGGDDEPSESLKDAWKKGLKDAKGKQRVAGMEMEFTPTFSLVGEFEDEICSWNYGGYIGVEAAISASVTWPTVIITPVTPPIPGYYKASADLALGFNLGIEDLLPEPQFNGKLDIGPYLRGTIAAGVDGVAALEGWVGGGADIGFQFPVQPPLNEASLYVNAGATAYVWIFSYEVELFRKTLDLLASNGSPPLASPLRMTPARGPSLIARNYLVRPDYAVFDGGTIPKVQALGDGDSGPSLTPIQTTIYPRSQATLSAGGSHLDLAWLYDDPARDVGAILAPNRTELVWSGWSGSAWSTPVAIADDGTADFHPNLFTSGDGSVMAVWEDLNTVIDNTTLPELEDVTANMEISTSVYNPTTQTWGPEKTLTANSILDRTPQLAGSFAADLLLIWIANDQNDIQGSGVAPNTIMAAWWNGADWSAPEVVATVPNYIVKYDVVYDGTRADIVLTMDTDGNSATVEDHELFHLEYGGAWNQMVQLTSDVLADDNPQLAFDPTGDVVMAWLRGNEVSGVTNFDFANRSVIRTDEYTTNLADFKLASNGTGQIALVWAETTQSEIEPDMPSSDIKTIFYDPILDVWGHPRQLTSDPEIEQAITAAFVDDTLFSVYNRTEMVKISEEVVTGGGDTLTVNSFEAGTTGLYMLEHQISSNLSVAEDGIAMTPPNPLPGTPVTLGAQIENIGDTGAEDVIVAFYNGSPDPANLIDTVVAEGILAPGAAKVVTLDWTIPAGVTNLQISVLVDPDLALEDSDRLNNTLTSSFLEPDLTIATADWEKIGDNYYVTFDVINQGAVDASSTGWVLRGAESGTITSGSVGVLEPYNSTDIEIGPLTANQIANANYTLIIEVDQNNALQEFEEANNAMTLNIDRLMAGMCEPLNYFIDGDGDGYGDHSALPIETCSPPQTGTYVLNDEDRDDSNNTVYPNAPELCDGLDNDQNYRVDDGACAPGETAAGASEPARVPILDGWWLLAAVAAGGGMLRRRRQ